MNFYCNIIYNFPHSSHKLQLEFTMENSDILHLKGPNGSGKTTLFNIINGFLEPTCGVIILNGKTLYNSKKGLNIKPQKRNIARVFQDYNLFPHMNVHKNLSFANKDTALLNTLIEKFSLEPLLHKNIYSLSGGQRQKISIIQNLVAKPQLLLLDEAFSNLDNNTILLFQDIISNLCFPVIIASHNPSFIDNFVSNTFIFSL